MKGGGRSSVDPRTRPINGPARTIPASFFEGAWHAAAALPGGRAAEDLRRQLGLQTITLRVDEAVWTLQPTADGIEAVPGRRPRHVSLDGAAFADLFCERRTAMGLVIAGRVEGDTASNDAFCAWDPVLRSLLDGRSVYRSGDVSLLARDGSPLDLEQRFRLGQDTAAAAHFLEEAGFLLLQGVFTEAEMDAVDADLRAAVEAARPGDGTSWWASTAAVSPTPATSSTSHSSRPAAGPDRRRALRLHRCDPR